MKPASSLKRAAAAVLGSLAALAFAMGAASWGVGWWIDSGDEPAPADAIVVLSGAFNRAAYGGDLYARGLAPEVWISRARALWDDDFAREQGAPVPLEEAVSRDILARKGVPASRVRAYGRAIGGTLEEARALAAAADWRGRKVLVVTSRFHARRSRLIFRRALPGAEVRVCASPYEPFSRRWWRRKELALQAAQEVLKTAYYLAGGSFVSEP